MTTSSGSSPSSVSPSPQPHLKRHWAELVRAASRPYRRAGLFARKFAEGKLGWDPVFHEIVRQGLVTPQARVLDIGCGQGLLASLLLSCTEFAQKGRWPAGWAMPPVGAQVQGIELMPRDVRRAQEALGTEADVVCGDMRHTPFPKVDTVVILDVLHYIAIDEQNDVLTRVRQALPDHGALLLRVGDGAAGHRVWVTRVVDAMVTLVRGHRVVPQHVRTLPEWIAQLESLGFAVRAQPMSQGTPFANVLLIAKVNAS